MATELERDVTDLPDGTRIPTGDNNIGTLTVLSTFDDWDDSRPLAPRLAGVEVDVTCDPRADIWDMGVLAKATGAQDAWWLANTPQRRYRLYYRPNATVHTIDDTPED